LCGPYRRWHHEHRFVRHEDGTEVSDQVEHSVCGGSIVNTLLVAPEACGKIFAYRSGVLPELLASKGA
jgi:ligand-binding SRPBCC domain-containing protein